ncbi:MAG TPA: prolipoprotein diacylglyceryl transferase [Cyclobacteriaceae bacterium]|nr:prolipoprotein diacylglyceryl transferase [Cyclobacteriaceae bacterium]
MHPVLFEIGPITIYGYGFMIMIGAILAYLYMSTQARKKYALSFESSNNLLLLIILAAVVGGKLFMIFEDPSHYLSKPKALLSPSGFVFYGSLLTAIPVMLWYFKKEKLPVLGMLDIMAIAACIVHMLGRQGCFLAGCCYGTVTDSALAVVFDHPQTMARPIGVPIHPTQLYDSFQILIIMGFLFWLKNRKQFDGQLFLVYLMLYAFGRSIIEIFRGDISRGYLIQDWLSNSQFISIVIIGVAGYFYIKLKRKADLINRSKRKT